MASSVNKYILQAETKGFKKAEGQTKKLGSSMGSLTKSVGGVALAYFSAQGLISAISGSIQAFGRQEQAEKKLETALGKTSRALLDQASALQQVSIFGDEAIIEQQGFLASLKFSEEQIKSIIPVAMDLASATGMSLESAVRNTAKTFSGLAGELGEMVPQLRELTAEQMKNGDAVKVLGELLGGQAQSQAETMTGAIIQMTNAIGDTAEVIGSALSPAVIIVANTIKLFAEGVGGLVNWREEILALSKDAKMLTEAEYQLLLLKEGLDEMTRPEIIEKIQELGGSVKEFGESSAEVGTMLGVATEGSAENYEMLKLLYEAYMNADESVDNFTLALEDYKVKQEESLAEKEREQELIEALIEQYPELAEKMGLVKAEIQDQINLAPILNDVLVDAFNPNLQGSEATIKKFITNLLSLFQGVILTSKAVNEALTFAFVPVIGTATAIASLVALEGAKALVNSASFHSGGLISGGDDVPINAQGGEFVMQRSAVESIGVDRLQAMNDGGGGMSINISAPLVDDTIVDIIIPQIERAYKEGLA